MNLPGGSERVFAMGVSFSHRRTLGEVQIRWSLRSYWGNMIKRLVISIGLLSLVDAALSQTLSIRPAVQVDVPTQPGVYYQVESSSDLAEWRTVGDPFRGTGLPVAKSFLAQPTEQFFRSIVVAPQPTEAEEIIFQYSTLGALLEGLYEGELRFDDLLGRGDLGLGTFQGVDGELVILDGEAYRIRVDGMVSVVAPETLTPFAVVTFFEPDLVFELSDIEDFGALGNAIDERLPSDNLLYALRVTGLYESLTTRSVPEQERPFPPLVDVVGDQTTFDLSGAVGTMVGFRLPAYIGELNATGYHFHFVDDARTRGGHVLQLGASTLRVEVDICQRLEMALPENEDFQLAPLE